MHHDAHGKSLVILKVLLGFVGVSHLLIGAGAMLSPVLQERVAALYGIQVELTPALSHLGRVLGAFMVGLGLMGCAAALDPLRHRLIVYGFAAILAIRATQRLVHFEEITATLGLESARVALHAGFFLAISIALVVLLQLATRRETAAPRAATT